MHRSELSLMSQDLHVATCIYMYTYVLQYCDRGVWVMVGEWVSEPGHGWWEREGVCERPMSAFHLPTRHLITPSFPVTISQFKHPLLDAVVDCCVHSPPSSVWNVLWPLEHAREGDLVPLVRASQQQFPRHHPKKVTGESSDSTQLQAPWDHHCVCSVQCACALYRLPSGQQLV